MAYTLPASIPSQVKCLTLFVTHYPLISQLESKYPSATANFHMAYIPVEDAGKFLNQDSPSQLAAMSLFPLGLAEAEFEKVVFLYHLERGEAAASYGLNVASLAGLPDSILRVAHSKSKQLEEEVLKAQSGRGAQECVTACQLLALLSQPHTSVSQVLHNFFSKTAGGLN